MRRTPWILGLISLSLGACAAPLPEDLFVLAGQPLEDICLSEGEDSREMCHRHIQGLLGDYYDQQDRIPKDRRAVIGCCHGEPLTLRNAAIQGHDRVREAVDWAQSEEGREHIVGAELLSHMADDFYARIVVAREELQSARADGLRWSCRLALLWRR